MFTCKTENKTEAAIMYLIRSHVPDGTSAMKEALSCVRKIFPIHVTNCDIL